MVEKKPPKTGLYGFIRGCFYITLYRGVYIRMFIHSFVYGALEYFILLCLIS